MIEFTGVEMIGFCAAFAAVILLCVAVFAPKSWSVTVEYGDTDEADDDNDTRKISMIHRP